MIGHALSWDTACGLGFLRGADDVDYFVHLNTIDSRAALVRGHIVQFEPVITPHGTPHGARAMRVRPLLVGMPEMQRAPWWPCRHQLRLAHRNI